MLNRAHSRNDRGLRLPSFPRVDKRPDERPPRMPKHTVLPPSSTLRRGRRVGWLSVGIAVLTAIGILGAAPAATAATPSLTADPASISVGASSTITATGLGGLETAAFGLDGTPGGSFTENGDTVYDAPVSSGSATATFTASQAGTFTVAVGDGETPLATVVVTVTDDAPSGGATVTVDPARIAAGETATVTVNGLGGLETASFGLDNNSAGTFEPGGTSSASVPVSDGTATATFTASEEGTVTIAVGDGETVLATAEVTVTAASPTPTATPTTTPTATPTASPTPSPQPSGDGGMPAWGIWLIVAIVILAAAAVAVTLIVTRRRGANPPS